MILACIAGLTLGLASTVHCAAMCGPLALVACGGRSRRHWFGYLLGRLLTYTAAGALAGGLVLNASAIVGGPWIATLASWGFAVALGVAAARLWATCSELSRQGAAVNPVNDPLIQLTPGRTAPPVQGLFGRWLRALRKLPSYLVGAGQVLLPCGALAAALLVAASQGSATKGALAMGAFAVSSSAGLAGLGLLRRGLTPRSSPLASRILAVALAVGAVFMIVRPLPQLAAAASSEDAPPAASCPLHSQHTLEASDGLHQPPIAATTPRP
jgi:sulfite exporter TauE/SafE